MSRYLADQTCARDKSGDNVDDNFLAVFNNTTNAALCDDRENLQGTFINV